jgi:hypothetical protein
MKFKQLMLILALCCLMSTQVFAGKNDKGKANSQEPYATAEFESAPAVSSGDLAYRIILFDEIKIPQEYQKDKNVFKHVEETLSGAISRLERTKAFSKVEKAKTPLPEEPYLLVKCSLLDYRIVSKSSRFFVGGLSGTSYMSYAMKVMDGKSGNLLHELDVTTENNIMSGAWSMGASDAGIPSFLGNVIADYLILRAKNDKGTSIVPLEKIVPEGATFTSPDGQLMWAVKDNHENAGWDQAVQYAKNFRGGNFSDWRLPSDQELLGLYDKNKPVAFKNGHTVYFVDSVVPSGYWYWTNVEKGSSAKYVDFERGQVYSKKKDDGNSMRTLVVRNAK